ncbi:MAG: hypothetical protein MH252_19590 [Thermosynechococcaceae cyanobacterium MS004]|nr:hypothetical protein [Thermosynechococcaceae cyanobacterium MS004]
MNREAWEHQFALLLKQKLGITPEQVQFHWRVYYGQRFSPEQAIADLERKHELYPELGLLPLRINLKNEV